MKQDNFGNRYLIKIGSSIFIAILNMLIQFILPRAFSVEEYGFYTYNLNVFTSVVVMANLSMSNALVAKFSKSNEEIGFIYFYLRFFCLMTIVLNVAVVFLYSFKSFRNIFSEQTFIIILLGLEAALVNKLLSDCIAIYDASAISRFPAVMQIILKAIVSMLIVISYLEGYLNLLSFYIVQVFVTLFVISIMMQGILKDQRQRYPKKIDRGLKTYVKEFSTFCRPLVLSAVIAQLITIIMNWSLLRWSGTTEQAMFGAAWQLNTLVTYVFSPYAELSKREFAVISNDCRGLQKRYIQAQRLMIWLTSYFAIFIAFCSEWIVPIVYGDKYSKATMVTILIMFYTVYQAWGQIAGAYMLALEKTKASAMIAVLGQLLTLVAVFLFQIPNRIWPDSLGALGIALNYLIVNILSVAVSVGFIAHSLRLSKWKIYAIQFPPILICTVLILCLKMVINYLIPENGIVFCIVKTLLAGIIYTLAFCSIIYLNPFFLGIRREDISNLLRRMKRS